MRKGFATIFREIVLVVAATLAVVGLSGRSDWWLLVPLLGTSLTALALIILRHLPAGPAGLPGAAPTTGVTGRGNEGAGAAAATGPASGKPGGREIVDAVPDPLLVLDQKRNILLANRAARDLFGADIEGGSLLSVLRQPALQAALATLGRGEEPEPLELPAIAGRIFSPELVACDGGGTLVMLRDLSSQRRVETLRSDFVANVSHELKTPLATLIGFLETLKGPARDDEAARTRFLEIMLTEAHRMSRIVADLLSLSRIELNEHQMPPGHADLERVLSGVLDGLAPCARQRGIVICQPDPGSLPTVPGDADELTQVLQNLVGNALKYGREKSVLTILAETISDPAQLQLLLPQSKSAAGAIAITVRDQGPGIAREHLPRLTERFYRVDTARSREMGGTGLGLAIVKHIVSRHRGKLEIQSVPGEGTSVTVYLPMDVVPQRGVAA